MAKRICYVTGVSVTSVSSIHGVLTPIGYC